VGVEEEEVVTDTDQGDVGPIEGVVEAPQKIKKVDEKVWPIPKELGMNPVSLCPVPGGQPQASEDRASGPDSFLLLIQKEAWGAV
jgi:hypothetical protein